jgi:hypothetical protein
MPIKIKIKGNKLNFSAKILNKFEFPQKNASPALLALSCARGVRQCL